MRRLLIAAFLSILAGQASAAPLLADNFNSENGGVGALAYGNFTNWNVTSGNVDLIGAGLYDLLPGNGLYLDLSGYVAGTIASKIVFAPGTYHVQFSLAGSQRGLHGIARVTLGSLDRVLDLTDNQPFTTESLTATVTTPAPLVFTSLVPGNVGALLDNVSVAAPEPRSVAILAIGGLGLLALRQRARRRV